MHYLQNLNNRIHETLRLRREEGLIRKLALPGDGVDFYSNDYLGLARNATLHDNIANQVAAFGGSNHRLSGSTGSRLLSGNSVEAMHLEAEIATYFKSEDALLFNSGYAANIGVISAFVRPDDVVLADESIHASMHDGIKMCKATVHFFRHNDLNHLESLLKLPCRGQRFVLIETVYSMDGDIAPLPQLVVLAQTYDAAILADEAHAGGVFGPNGEGLAVQTGHDKAIFARIVTFSKAFGCHGAVVLCNHTAKNYLLNFSRSFIYSTALSFTALIEIQASMHFAFQHKEFREHLHRNITLFNTQLLRQINFSLSPIHAIKVEGNFSVAQKSAELNQQGFEVRPLRYPTVPRGSERIRICLHSFNTPAEIISLTQLLA